jgi:hypothetical protein
MICLLPLASTLRVCFRLLLVIRSVHRLDLIITLGINFVKHLKQVLIESLLYFKRTDVPVLMNRKRCAIPYRYSHNELLPDCQDIVNN